VTLRRQLLLVSLLLLSLPWAGCQFVREMESALRLGQEQSLEATAQAVAALLGQREQLLYPYPDRLESPGDSGLELYAHPMEQPLILDGYGDGWEEIPGDRFDSDPDAAALTVLYQAVTRKDYLYLLLKVADPVVIYHNPGLSREPNGDRLILRTWQNNRRQEYVIATAAPGKVRAQAASRRQRGTDAGRIRGYWQDAIGGYTLELEIPLSFTGGRLGFYLVNTGSKSGQRVATLGNINALETGAPPWLIYNPRALQQALQPLSNSSGQIQIIDRNGWLLAELSGSSGANNNTPETFWLLQSLYRYILSRDELETAPEPTSLGKVRAGELDTALSGSSATRRYRDSNYATRTTLSTAVPIANDKGVIGAVVIRQSGEQYLTLTDQAFGKLLGYSLLALGIAAFGLLAYATLLSWRIGRLSLAASHAIGDDGRVLDTFPRSQAGDEIGELSRSYADLLDRLREYNDYLRTLSRKLSHELRTPIAVIQTSLENLEQANDPAEHSNVYLTRAREGLARLNGILTAMSEANRLEESIRSNSMEETDLVALLREVFAAYSGIYAQQKLVLEIAEDVAMVTLAPDLIVQALDKLMDNAASFCPVGGTIQLQLVAFGSGWNIFVQNEGPILPLELQEHLFDPMVSLRDTQNNAVHLGLGLHIVRLIVDFHRGWVKAENLPEQRGVRVTMHLPTQARTAN
jgi:dedicated sortase system histidine kinase